MASTLFGFGGTLLECGETSASFPNNTGNIAFKRKAQTWVTRDNIERHRFLGYQPTISVQLHNLNDEMAIEWANLVAVINEHHATGTAITVTPRYDEDSEYGLPFSCTLISDFNPQDIARCEAGQTIDLVFQATQLYTEIPSVFSGVTVYDVIDGSGNTIVDGDGDTIIMAT